MKTEVIPVLEGVDMYIWSQWTELYRYLSDKQSDEVCLFRMNQY